MYHFIGRQASPACSFNSDPIASGCLAQTVVCLQALLVAGVVKLSQLNILSAMHEEDPLNRCCATWA